VSHETVTTSPPLFLKIASIVIRGSLFLHACRLGAAFLPRRAAEWKP
jgi:hypothetical protein